MPPKKKSDARPHTRNLRQLRITILPEHDDAVRALAERIRKPGFQPNVSEAMRAILAGWAAGEFRESGPKPVKRGRAGG